MPKVRCAPSGNRTRCYRCQRYRSQGTPLRIPLLHVHMARCTRTDSAHPNNRIRQAGKRSNPHTRNLAIYRELPSPGTRFKLRGVRFASHFASAKRKRIYFLFFSTASMYKSNPVAIAVSPAPALLSWPAKVLNVRSASARYLSSPVFIQSRVRLRAAMLLPDG